MVYTENYAYLLCLASFDESVKFHLIKTIDRERINLGYTLDGNFIIFKDNQAGKVNNQEAPKFSTPNDYYEHCVYFDTAKMEFFESINVFYEFEHPNLEIDT